MLKQFCTNIEVVQNHINMLSMMGYDPHIQLSRKPSFSRAQILLLSPVELSLPKSLQDRKKVTLRAATRSMTNYNIDYENAVIAFNTTFNGVPFRCVLPLENIIGVSTGDSAPSEDKAFYFEYNFGSPSEPIYIIPNPLASKYNKKESKEFFENSHFPAKPTLTVVK